MAALFSVGDAVRILPPFDTIESGGEVATVAAIQFIAADGTISEIETDAVQYVLSGSETIEGLAFVEANLVAAS